MEESIEVLGNFARHLHLTDKILLGKQVDSLVDWVIETEGMYKASKVPMPGRKRVYPSEESRLLLGEEEEDEEEDLPPIEPVVPATKAVTKTKSGSPGEPIRKKAPRRYGPYFKGSRA